jgi:hypothetical protein
MPLIYYNIDEHGKMVKDIQFDLTSYKKQQDIDASLGVDRTYEDDSDKESELDFDNKILDIEELDELDVDELDDTYETAYRCNMHSEE